MKYKLAIFDFDGTLADSFHWFLQNINVVADKYRFRRIEDDEIETLRGYDNRKIIEHLKVPMWKMPLIQHFMRKRMANDIDRISLFSGVDQMLKGLTSKGIATAIVTSNSAINAQTVLGTENKRLIKYYACDARFFNKPAKIRKVLRWSGISAAETICIGDEVRDIQAARAENIAFGAVPWGYANLKSLSLLSPEEIFLNLSDIVEKLCKEKVKNKL
jgi:phosphoglycolate phosphatase